MLVLGNCALHSCFTIDGNLGEISQNNRHQISFLGLLSRRGSLDVCTAPVSYEICRERRCYSDCSIDPEIGAVILFAVLILVSLIVVSYTCRLKSLIRRNCTQV